MTLLKRILKHFRKKRAFRLINGKLSNAQHFERKRKLLIKAGYKIGEGTKIVGPILITTEFLTIGKNCWIGLGFEVLGNGEVIIGDNCDIAPNVHIHTGGHKIGKSDRRAGEGIHNNITIGNGCWLCGETTIVNSVKIGSGCIVVPGAVVTKDVDENTMVGGVPAKFIKNL